MLRHSASPVRHPGIRNSTTLFASYYLPSNQLAAAGAAVVVAGRAYATLFEGMAGAVVNRLGIEVTVGAAGNARLGLYQHDPGTGHWGPLLVDGGNVDTSAAALVEAAIAELPCPELFWMVVLPSAGPTLRVANQDNSARFGNLSPSSATGGRGLRTTQAFGALPATLPDPTTYDGNAPTMWLRYAS